MEPQLVSYLQLLERRIEMLRSLSVALRQSQEAMTELDLERIYQTTLQQETLCSAISLLDREIQTAQATAQELISPSAHGDSALEDQLRKLALGFAEAQREVWHLNRVQAGLLRRSRRSLNVLLNLLANYSGTYQVSGSLATSILPVTVEV